MSMRFDSGRERRKKSSGFYIALGLCGAAALLVIATSRMDSDATADTPLRGSYEQGTAVYDQAAEDINDIIQTGGMNMQNVSSADTSAAAESGEQDELYSADVSAPAEDEFTDDTPDAQNMSLENSEEAIEASAAPEYHRPVEGSIINGFSGDELVYCSTMCDWRVHNGVDIAAESDSEVKAAADGIVYDVVVDMLYGNTVIISHDDGSMLYYCGLNSTQVVSKGLEVKAGDVIGYIGEVPCESDAGPHLHLTMMKDGGFVDPIKELGLV